MPRSDPMPGVLLTEREGAVAILTLNRPERRNALNTPLLRALEASVRAAQDDDQVDVVVLTGADPAFCGGVDTSELEETGRTPAMGDPLDGLTKPLIGAVNGPAVTGGLELALMCDLLVASERAMFADTHARLGLLPGWGQMARLPHTVGPRLAAEMLLTSVPVGAERAHAIGLVNEVVPHRKLLGRARELAHTIATADGPTVQAMLAQLREGAGRPLATLLQTERDRAAAWQGKGFDRDLVSRERARVSRRMPGD